MCSLALFNLKETVIWNYPFIKINEFTLYFGLQADKTSLIMALLLFIVSFAVQIYSISYSNRDKDSHSKNKDKNNNKSLNTKSMSSSSFGSDFINRKFDKYTFSNNYFKKYTSKVTPST